MKKLADKHSAAAVAALLTIMGMHASHAGQTLTRNNAASVAEAITVIQKRINVEGTVSRAVTSQATVN